MVSIHAPSSTIYHQHQMDYYLDPTQRYPQETTRSPGTNPVLPILEEVLDPTGTHVSSFKGCIIISLDTEYNSRTQEIKQVGLASLDTREIYRADNEELVTSTLSSRLLLLQKQKSDKGAYLFGRPEEYYGRSLSRELLSIFRIIDTNTIKPRNIVLVGHSIRSEIREIERSSGLNILALPMIKAIVDTSLLVNRVYNTSSRAISLRSTCTLLGMYKRNIHNAGNDAMHTLKALLLMFCHYKGEKLSWTSDDEPTDRVLLYKCQLEAMKRIGRCNNGVGRFMKQRKRKIGVVVSRQRRDKTQSHDLFDGTEEGIMNEIFIT